VRVGTLYLATLADSAALNGSTDYVGRLVRRHFLAFCAFWACANSSIQLKMLVGPVGNLDAAITKAVVESASDAISSSSSSSSSSNSAIHLSGSLLPSVVASNGNGSAPMPQSPSPQPQRTGSGSISPNPSALSRSNGATGSPRALFSTRVNSPRADMHAPTTSRTTNPVAFNYLTFNHPTQTQSGAVSMRKQPEAEKNFLRIVSHAHDVFYENPQVSKLIMKYVAQPFNLIFPAHPLFFSFFSFFFLFGPVRTHLMILRCRDASSNIFCRNLFGRETFYQQPNSVAFKNLEDAARDNLSIGDDGLTLI
jgi:hypothetical protein